LMTPDMPSGTPPGPPTTAIPVPARQLGLAVPLTWRRRSDPDRGVLLAARATWLPPSGVRPELVLRICRADAGEDLTAWRERVMGELADLLVDFALEDGGEGSEYDRTGHPVAYRRFAHRLGSTDVLCDQWAWLLVEAGVGAGVGVGITLTCSVAREEYGEYCDAFQAIAASLDPSPEAA
ncbi:MAG: hypothetical protein WB471_02665, partial [Nocardioides sp.]